MKSTHVRELLQGRGNFMLTPEVRLMYFRVATTAEGETFITVGPVAALAAAACPLTE